MKKYFILLGVLLFSIFIKSENGINMGFRYKIFYSFDFDIIICASKNDFMLNKN